MEQLRLDVIVAGGEAATHAALRRALGDAGCTVRSVGSANAVIAAYLEHGADLFVIDARAGLEQACDACAGLRKHAGPGLAVVMLTPTADPAAAQACYDHGATDFIAGAIDPAAVTLRLAHLFRERDWRLHARHGMPEAPAGSAVVPHAAAQAHRAAQPALDTPTLERSAAVLDALTDPLFELDAYGVVRDFRAPHQHKLMLGLSDYLDRHVADIAGAGAAAAVMACIAEAAERGYSQRREFLLVRPEGLERWIQISVARKTGNADAGAHEARFVALTRDVTDHRQAEDKAVRLERCDSLTGLSNRDAFLARADRVIGDAALGARHPSDARSAPSTSDPPRHAPDMSDAHPAPNTSSARSAHVAMVVMDLNGFDDINDTAGHRVGDAVLRFVAARLRQSLRTGAPAVTAATDRPARRQEHLQAVPDAQLVADEVARLGGDEFAALLPGTSDSQGAMAAAERVAQALRRPFLVEDREYRLSASIGIAMHPEDGADAATLLQHAHIAMHHAKTAGRDTLERYSESLTTNLVRRVDLEAALRAAVDLEQFELRYQPQVDAASGRMHSLEALIRWNHPTRGMVAPLEFIALAEHVGLIERIGDWVLGRACRDAAGWKAAGWPMRVSVNLSPVQLRSNDFADRVMRVLRNSGLDPDLLELEVTEGVLIEQPHQARALLHDLRERGVRSALDDFGIGYSSLGYLTSVPIDHIKIDRSFVAGLPDAAESGAIVRAVLALASSLHMRTTAEGVETPQQARALRSMGCDGMQGFYFSEPVRTQDVPALVQRRWSLRGLEKVPAQAG